MGLVKNLWIEEQERGWSSFDNVYVCANCIEDEALQALITDNAVQKECSYCEAVADEPIAADMNVVVERIHWGLCQEWSSPNDEGVPYETSEGGWQGEVLDTYSLLWNKIALGTSSVELFNDIAESMSEGQWCQRDFWRLSPHKELIFDWRHFSNTVKHESRFLFLNKAAEPEMEIRSPSDVLDVLGGYFRQFNLVTTLPVGTEFVRARRHERNEHPRTIAEFGPPPRFKSVSSRMSPAGIPMLYIAFDRETATAEVCSDPADLRPLVTTARLRLKQQISVLDLSAIPPVPSLFDYDKASERPACIFLRDFSDDFTAPVVKDGREHIDYVPTQIVTEYVKQMFRYDDDEGIQGVIYPSAVSNGRSCVLFFEGVPDDLAPLHPQSVEKWMELVQSQIETVDITRTKSSET